MAHILDLGYLCKKENMKSTNKAIIKYNYRKDMSKHANFMRSFALGNESALLMASYPGERPKKPFPYFTEVMSGFEYAAVNKSMKFNANNGTYFWSNGYQYV